MCVIVDCCSNNQKFSPIECIIHVTCGYVSIIIKHALFINVQDALEQLLVTLNYLQKVLSAKKLELESNIPFGAHHKGKGIVCMYVRMIYCYCYEYIISLV